MALGCDDDGCFAFRFLVASGCRGKNKEAWGDEASMRHPAESSSSCMAHSPTCRPKLSTRDGSEAQTLHILTTTSSSSCSYPPASSSFHLHPVQFSCCIFFSRIRVWNVVNANAGLCKFLVSAAQLQSLPHWFAIFGCPRSAGSCCCCCRSCGSSITHNGDVLP